MAFEGVPLIRTVVAALLVMVLGSVVPSTAAEQLVRGRLFVVSNPLRSNPSRRLVTVTASTSTAARLSSATRSPTA